MGTRKYMILNSKKCHTGVKNGSVTRILTPAKNITTASLIYHTFCLFVTLLSQSFVFVTKGLKSDIVVTY